MQSKTSFCNPTVIRKNLTRFAPLWGTYLVCLLVGLFMVYANDSQNPEYSGSAWAGFWYIHRLTEVMPMLAGVNSIYALVAAQLLFGDLYNSRTCNMLHALPLRREGWFVSNCISGILFSVIPLALFSLVATVLSFGTIVQNGWTVPTLVFAAGNLQFVTFFGMAVFAAMATANRFTMVAGYGLMNLGVFLTHWMLITVYTPMLHGVKLLEEWALDLTPFYTLFHGGDYASLEGCQRISAKYGEHMENAVARFTLGDSWGTLAVWTLVGVVLLGAALVMYRKRHLECAGDAVAFSFLKPVFLVLCSVTVSAAAYGLPREIIGYRQTPMYLMLAVGLVIGWFIAKMLIEHTTRVFRLRNWYGLVVLALVMGATLLGTHFDVLNIVGRQPAIEDIAHASVSEYYWGLQYEFTDPEDLEAIQQLHRLALEDRIENKVYTLENGEYVPYEYPEEIQESDQGNGPTNYSHTFQVSVTYTLKNGSTMVREYYILADSEAGRLYGDLTTSWDYLNFKNGKFETPEGELVPTLDYVLDHFENLSTTTSDYEDPIRFTKAQALELIEALKADCAEGTMSQVSSLHQGWFRVEDRYSKEGYYDRNSLYIDLEGRLGKDYSWSASWSVRVYPESRHTLQWMEDQGLLEGIEIFHQKQPLW